MNTDDLMPIVITAVVSAIVSGGVSAVFGSILTTAALRVHIDYLRQACNDNKDALKRAHERIDELVNGRCKTTNA